MFADVVVTGGIVGVLVVVVLVLGVIWLVRHI